MVRTVVILAGLGLAACGGSLDDAEARDVFALSNGLVHELHLDAMALPAWPTELALACPDGGRIAMTSVVVNGVPDDLFHAFEGCEIEGWTVDGQLDYLDITFCPEGTPSFAITGRLEIADHGACAIAAQETCGVITGTTCGATI